ncbi:response regulator transcription factor [Sulfobacillus thermosulfidooxidans]|uniref:response regulator transcription factor n=1 Tax=Sulfobacillus thermosulfidooxidans TaxID=28034 RepID=UPI0006B5170E|nr:response regulator transcription factor [Sulfobacillus thermosulfidooxidans]
MKLLVVEDENSLARLMQLELSHAGFSVDVVHNGHDALRYFVEHQYDCILLDVMLPDLSGFEICRRIRLQASIPIIMVTARGQTPDIVAGLELGGDDYIVKPVNFEELTARIRAVTRRNHMLQHDAEKLVMKNLVLVIDEFRAEVAGKPLTLSALEFRLLEHFVRNHKLVQTREVLLEHVWGIDFRGESNMVDVSVGRLRRKLRRAGSDVDIETIRGVGYVLRNG